MAHIPVLLNEVIDYLVPNGRTIERAIDGTLGAGGHTKAMLEVGVEHVLAFDLDLQAIVLAQDSLSHYTDHVTIVHDSYLQMAEHAQYKGWNQVDAILLDLGLSSMQLDTAERGFAFKHDGVLDMRFNKDGNQPTAAYLVNHWAADDLADIFYKYGEERHSRRIAREIIKHRPFVTTQQLAERVAIAMPRGKKSKIHPATRVFQALRIAVNDELQTVESALPIAINLLKTGGRLAVITFHSLEDRIVKNIFKDASTEIIAPPGMASIEEKEAIIKLLNRKPIVPSATEIARNPRSRSSKLRVVEKL
ncbi:MAG: 16S rRNA (cytosine(1402)-N(4))-methyltransferase RsmH [Anaerolineae bacterium]|nr:16S rRNA (cytosine(1402)-N(4))-methyltransferase RsmH [Anaerolineae bacterium]